MLTGMSLSPQGGYWVIATEDSVAYSWLGWSQGWGSGVPCSAFHCPMLSYVEGGLPISPSASPNN